MRSDALPPPRLDPAPPRSATGDGARPSFWVSRMDLGREGARGREPSAAYQYHVPAKATPYAITSLGPGGEGEIAAQRTRDAP